jgi:CheY-like chemotaxis protein
MDALKILSVDDDPDLRDVGLMSLELDPALEVRTASSAAEALAQLDREDWRPDLFMLDVMMPEMDGPNLLRAIRTRPGLTDIPAIFITARVGPSERAQFLEAGAIGVIAKPFDPMQLGAEVRSLQTPARTG